MPNINMKILFLDHDGVVCLPHNWGSRVRNNEKFDRFDRKCIKALNHILDKTDCEIVVSSNWKIASTLLEMQQLYKQYGVNKYPIGLTDDLLYEYPNDNYWDVRRYEILKYIEENNIEQSCAVDDLPLNMTNFVMTDDEIGLRDEEVVERIIKILL